MRINGQQDNWTFKPKSRSSDNSVDCTPMAGKTCLPQQFASPACDLSTHWDDGEPRYNAVRSGVAGTASEHFCQRDGAHHNSGTSSTSGF